MLDLRMCQWWIKEMKKTQPLFSGFENCIWECIGKRAMALVMNRADIQKFALEAACGYDLSTENLKHSHTGWTTFSNDMICL